MKPICLKGHTKSLTHIVYNHDGDLLFSCAKDYVPCVWWSDTGERLGTYEGHKGAVFSCDPTRDSEHLLTAAADSTVRFWKTSTGECQSVIAHPGPVRCVKWGTGDDIFMSSTSAVMGKPSYVNIFKCDYENPRSMKQPIQYFAGPEKIQISRVDFSMLNEHIYASFEDGSMRCYDTETGKQLSKMSVHKANINTFQLDKHKIFMVTASADGTAKLLDAKTLSPIKVYDTGRPVNAAAMSPIYDHIICGGGEKVDVVTQTKLNIEQFKVRFFHKVFEHELGTLAGHFGPVNSLSFSPDGKSFASGAEDGYVRIQHFDDDYFTYGEEANK